MLSGIPGTRSLTLTPLKEAILRASRNDLSGIKYGVVIHTSFRARSIPEINEYIISG